jgi:hypothetical protein
MGLFERLRIVDDAIKQAFICEIFIEMLGFRSHQKFFNKAGIRMTWSNKPFIYDRALRDALQQAAIKIYHIDTYREWPLIKIRAIRLAEEVFSWMKEVEKKNVEDGRVEETRVTGPLEKRGSHKYSPPLRGPAQAE